MHSIRTSQFLLNFSRNANELGLRKVAINTVLVDPFTHHFVISSRFPGGKIIYLANVYFCVAFITAL